MPDKYRHINFVPPAAVARAAARGLEYRQKAGGKGGLDTSEAKSEGIGSGVQRAVNLKNRDKMSPDTVRRMKAFFDRHQKNKSIKSGKKPWEDRGYVAWLLWGGDPGYSWANKVVSQMESAENRTKVKKASVLKVIQKYASSDEKKMHDALVDLLKKNPKPSDAEVHQLAESIGVDKHKLEEHVYRMLADHLKKTAADAQQLSMGKKVEKEHKDAYDLIKKKLEEKNVEMPISEDDFYTMIAQAHLKELDDYYTRLQKMEGGSHKDAMDFSSIAPVLTPEKKMDDRELARSIRLAIAAEHDAAHLYELMADASTNALAKKVLQDIADEEKVHVGELQELLSGLDDANKKSLEDGAKEVEEISTGGPASENE